jgi:hypothetical protein
MAHRGLGQAAAASEADQLPDERGIVRHRLLDRDGDILFEFAIGKGHERLLARMQVDVRHPRFLMSDAGMHGSVRRLRARTHLLITVPIGTFSIPAASRYDNSSTQMSKSTSRCSHGRLAWRSPSGTMSFASAPSTST